MPNATLTPALYARANLHLRPDCRGLWPHDLREVTVQLRLLGQKPAGAECRHVPRALLLHRGHYRGALKRDRRESRAFTSACTRPEASRSQDVEVQPSVRIQPFEEAQPGSRQSGNELVLWGRILRKLLLVVRTANLEQPGRRLDSEVRPVADDQQAARIRHDLMAQPRVVNNSRVSADTS